MSSTKIYLSILLLICFFNACKKDHTDSPTYKITGHLYNDCGMQPVKNFLLKIYQQQGSSYFPGHDDSGGFLGTVTTDSSGFFEFDFKDGDGGDLAVFYPAGAGYNTLFSDTPARTNISDLICYLTATTNIQVRLNVINPHSNNSRTFCFRDFIYCRKLSFNNNLL